MHISCFGEDNGSEQIPHIREFVNLVRDTKTKIYADVYPRCMPPRAYRMIAMSYYEAAAEGLTFRLLNDIHISEWAFVDKLGHKDDLAAWKGRGDKTDGGLFPRSL